MFQMFRKCVCVHIFFVNINKKPIPQFELLRLMNHTNFEDFKEHIKMLVNIKIIIIRSIILAFFFIAHPINIFVRPFTTFSYLK